ncbi:MAG: hypothetical protein PVG91_11005 [Gammaproteobacteria bacterium]|jgi:hypothetical protein
MMSLEQYAYLAEIVGAIAVVASLLYLAVQIHQSNLQGQASARYAFIQAMSDINMPIAQDKAVASVWRRGLESADGLDKDERIQFWMLVGQYGNAWSVMYQLYRDGMLPEIQWTVVRKDMLGILSSEGGRSFWKRFGAGAFDPEFVAYVDSLLSSGEKSYDMLAE